MTQENDDNDDNDSTIRDDAKVTADAQQDKDEAIRAAAETAANAQVDINARAAAEEEKMQIAAERLTRMMDENPKIQNLCATILNGYRLVQWATGELAGEAGATWEMVQIATQAQQARAVEAFSMTEMVDDLKEGLIDFLINQATDAKRRLNKRNKALKEMQKVLRRKSIEMPFHSMNQAAKFTEESDEGVAPGSVMVVFGPSEALYYLMRKVALFLEAKKVKTALFTAGGGDDEAKEARRVSQIVFPPAWYTDAAKIYGDFKQVMAPIAEAGTHVCLLEDLDGLRILDEMNAPREHTLVQALSVVQQYSFDFPITFIVGVNRDNDPEGSDPRDMYPEHMFTVPVIESNVAQSPIVGGGRNLVVGNDTVSVEKIQEEIDTAPKKGK